MILGLSGALGEVGVNVMEASIEKHRYSPINANSFPWTKRALSEDFVFQCSY